MSTSALLLIALASVVLLLLLVIKAKAHPFVALLIVSLLVAFATGIPADKIITTIEKGMGGLLGHIASIIILGSMLGVLIEMSGGAESLAKTLTGVLGAKRTIAALTIVAFILGTPVFFEVGFIIIIPLIYGFSKVAHVSPLKFGLPMAGVMLTVHVALPTHPGAAAAAGILHSDVGWLMLAGIGVSIVVGIVGYFVARFINRRHYHLSINVLEQQQTAEVPDLSVNAQQTRLPPPNALVIGGLIVVPIMLIVSGTLLFRSSWPARSGSRRAWLPRCARKIMSLSPTSIYVSRPRRVSLFCCVPATSRSFTPANRTRRCVRFRRQRRSERRYSKSPLRCWRRDEAGNGNRGQLRDRRRSGEAVAGGRLAGDRHEPFAAALLTAELSPSDGRRQPTQRAAGGAGAD